MATKDNFVFRTCLNPKVGSIKIEVRLVVHLMASKFFSKNSVSQRNNFFAQIFYENVLPFDSHRRFGELFEILLHKS